MNTIASASQLISELQSQLPNIVTVPVHQYYAKDQDGGFRFFYSPRPDVQNGWTYETIPFYAFDKQSPGVVPVYQYHHVYSDGSVKYYYSPKGNEGNNWKPDVPLPAFYAYEEAQPFTQPVYQYYADDQDGGKKYFYSIDPNAAKGGWELDFVAFHVAIGEKLELSVYINKLAITQPYSDTTSTTVGTDESFSVAIDFKGHGNVFENLAKQELDFEIEYFAKEMKQGDYAALGSVDGKLVSGQLIYSAPETELTIARSGDKLKPGCYRIGASLVIRDRFGNILVSASSEGSVEGPVVEVIIDKCGSKK